MRELPPGLIFDRSDARALGWSDAALSRAIRSGGLVSLRRGQLTRPATSVPDAISNWRTVRDQHEIIQALAASRAGRDSVISHRSAALIHALPVADIRSPRPTLTVPPRSASALSGANLHRATLAPVDVVTRGGVKITSVARTVVDYARSAPTLAAVATVDAALHLHLTTWSELDEVVLRCWNWPGIARAVRAIDLADARSESVLESRSRVVLHWLGLPAPTPQAELCTLDDTFLGRVDFYWDGFGVAGEADGAAKYDQSPSSLIEEKERQEKLEDLGVVFVRWGWTAPTRRPKELRDRVYRAFDRAMALSRSGLCREWSVRAPATGHTQHKADQDGG